MNIKDFIEELKKYNPMAKITTPYSETIKLSYVCDDGGSKRTARIVFIEWADDLEEKYRTNEITWYEDGNMIEWWENDEISTVNRKYDFCSVEEAISIAQKQKMLLIIQPMYQDQCIFIDYTEKVDNDA